MGQYAKIQIIELNGLAGCGKTTLARKLKDELIRKNYRVILFHEAYQVFKKHPFMNAAIGLNLPLFTHYIRLFFIKGRSKDYTLYFYFRYIWWVAIKISLVYRWCLKSGEVDFMICDHGHIQNIISLLGFEQLNNYEKFYEYLACVLKAESGICMVNCNVSIEQSLQRIRSRNKNTGRLDAVRDDLELKKLLRITENNFFRIRSIVSMAQKEWPIINLEMDAPTEVNIQIMLNYLSKGNESHDV